VKKISKSLIAVFAALGLVFTATPAVNAEPADQQVVAIIDAGFDAERFGDSVILEACVLRFNYGCNNHKGLELGEGAAGSPTSDTLKERYLEDWDHGNLMAEAVLAANPDAKLVLIKNGKVFGNVMMKASLKDFDASIAWVEENAEKYGIDAVSYSMASHRYVAKGGGNTARYQRMVDTYNRFIVLYESMGMNVSWLTGLRDKYQAKIDAGSNVVCPVPQATQNNIAALASVGIPTFIAAGNNADKDYVSNPACADAAFAVSSADSSGSLNRSTNFSPTKTDFVVPGPNTSTATASLAGAWSADSRVTERGAPVPNSNALLVILD